MRWADAENLGGVGCKGRRRRGEEVGGGMGVVGKGGVSGVWRQWRDRRGSGRLDKGRVSGAGVRGWFRCGEETGGGGGRGDNDRGGVGGERCCGHRFWVNVLRGLGRCVTTGGGGRRLVRRTECEHCSATLVNMEGVFKMWRDACLGEKKRKEKRKKKKMAAHVRTHGQATHI